MRPLDPLFAPRQVAVLGASRDPAKLGHVLLKNVLGGGFPGQVFAVNPAGESILGTATVPHVAELPAGIDLALVSLPPRAVLPAVKELAARGTRMAVILTSGFAEVDEQGRATQSALLDAARSGGLRLVGPNCMGVYSAPAALNGTFFWDLPRLPGGIAVVSQSGAYGGLIIRHLGGLGLGVSRFLSIGNQVDVGVAEALAYLADDPATSLVACFLEGVSEGRRLVEAVRGITAAKPVVVLKGGRTQAGRRAAGSHTGSLAGQPEVYHAAFRQAGAVLCGETEEFFDAIHALATVPTRPERPSLVIVTVSGGPSVVAADAAESLGIEVPATSAETQEALRSLLPSFAALGNPVDLTPQVEPHRIPESVRLILAKSQVAGALAINVGLDILEFADGLVDAARAGGKPLVACSVDAPGVAARFKAAAVPVFPTPERAVRAYRALWLASRGPAAVPTRAVRPVLRVGVESLLDSAHGALPHDSARQLLAAYGIRCCRAQLARSMPDAVEAARSIGYPVVVKTAREDVLHKTEAGAVLTGVQDAAALEQACRAITARVGDGGFLVEEQIPPAIELLLGGQRDESFGPVVAVGIGGFWAEAVRDVSLALAPLSLEEARALVPQGRRAALVNGYRGRPAWDVEPVARALVALGWLLVDHPRIREIDVNPVMASGADAVAVDALVLLD